MTDMTTVFRQVGVSSDEEFKGVGVNFPLPWQQNREIQEKIDHNSCSMADRSKIIAPLSLGVYQIYEFCVVLKAYTR